MGGRGAAGRNGIFAGVARGGTVGNGGKPEYFRSTGASLGCDVKRGGLFGRRWSSFRCSCSQPYPLAMARRRTLWLTICFLGLVLLGTVIVLSTTSYYLAINDNAYIDEQDFTPHPHHTEPKVHDHARRPHYNASAPARIPRIIHQTWKSETLGRWATLAKGCRDMHPD
jgi:hypothetical protein